MAIYDAYLLELGVLVCFVNLCSIASKLSEGMTLIFNLKLLKSSYFSAFKLMNSISAFNFALFLMSFTGHA